MQQQQQLQQHHLRPAHLQQLDRQHQFSQPNGFQTLSDPMLSNGDGSQFSCSTQDMMSWLMDDADPGTAQTDRRSTALW
jgi:hypothetical protein